jgi:hypothetical protein
MVSRASVRQQIMKPPAKRKRKSSKKDWIKGAIKRPGALRKKLGVKPGKKITTAQLNKASKSKNPRTRRQANLAKTLKKMSRKRRS